MLIDERPLVFFHSTGATKLRIRSPTTCIGLKGFARSTIFKFLGNNRKRNRVRVQEIDIHPYTKSSIQQMFDLAKWEFIQIKWRRRFREATVVGWKENRDNLVEFPMLSPSLPTSVSLFDPLHPRYVIMKFSWLIAFRVHVSAMPMDFVALFTQFCKFCRLGFRIL